VTRTRSPEIAKRNEEIFALWQRGASLASLGAKYKISRQVVGRVVASFHPEDDEDTDRSVYRGYLWRLFDEVREVYASPGYKMSHTGRPAVGPDDEPAEDVMAKIEAAKLQLAVLESLRKLDARDRVQPKIMTVQFDLAHQQMQRDLEDKRRELAATTRGLEAPVVAGELVREEQQRGEDGS
jgi:hypothetical protein